MDYLGHNISVNLKRIRKARNLSLDIIAEQTGVSKSMLSQIERGSANPSIGVLGKITSGLRIEFEDLIRSPYMDTCKVNVKHTVPIKHVEGQYKVWNCFPYQDNHQIEIYRIEIAPGQVYEAGSHGMHTREYISMSEGKLEIALGRESYLVYEDECFRFESDRFHQYKNVGNDVCVFYSFFVDYS